MIDDSKLNNKLVNFPFSPGKSPFFYGWVIVAISIIGTIASIPGQTMGVGVFTDYLIKALHLSRVKISTAYMIGTICSSFLLPLAGKLLDRIGIRTMVVLVSLGLGLSMVLLSISDMLTISASLVVSMIVISIIFLLMRFFGQGCLTMLSRVAIGRWFDHHRGMASAISGIFVSLGFNSSPVFLNFLVTNYGWKSAAITLALLVGIGMSFIGWLFFRDTPEKCGLKMDGNIDKEKISQSLPETIKEFTKNEAIRTHSFWAFSLGMAVISLIITAVTFHISSIGAEKGLTRQESYAVFLWSFPFSIVSNFISSWISDRIRHKWLLIAMMVAQAASLLGLLFFSTLSGRILFSAAQGSAGGLYVALATVAFPRFFGRQHLGEISGVNMSVLVFASAIGPVLFSAMHSLSGNYQSILLLSFILPITIIIYAIKAENPQSVTK